MDVLRGGNAVVINGTFFNLSSLVDAAYSEAKTYGAENPAFNMPGWFFTGSPYGQQLLDLATRHNISSIERPKEFVPEGVPKLGYVWRSKEPKWVDHYGVREIYESEMKCQ